MMCRQLLVVCLLLAVNVGLMEAKWLPWKRNVNGVLPDVIARSLFVNSHEFFFFNK
jgi:hypothetical protein